MDFFNDLRVANNPYISEKISPYFPFAMVIVKIFNIIGNKNVSLIIFLFIFICFFIYACFSALKTKKIIVDIRNVFIFIFLSYPVLFAIDRANFEIFVFIFMYFFIVLYYKKKTLLASIFLILAICMKLFPAVFLLLFLKDKKYKECSIVIFLSIIITIICYSALPGGLVANIIGHLRNLNLFNQTYAIGDFSLHMGNSIWGIIKISLKALQNFLQYSLGIENLSFLLKYYTYFTGLLFILVALYILFIEKIFWKIIFILTVILCILPHVSFDYKLLHLYIPLFFFINNNDSLNNNINNNLLNNSLNDLRNKYKFDLFYIIVFGLLLIPKDYYVLFDDVSISVILNPLLMISMAIVIIIEGFIKKNNLKEILSQK
jgi:hypothetical protein